MTHEQFDRLLIMTTLIKSCHSTHPEAMICKATCQTDFATHVLDNISQTIDSDRFVDVPLFWRLTPLTNFFFVEGICLAVSG